MFVVHADLKAHILSLCALRLGGGIRVHGIVVDVARHRIAIPLHCRTAQLAVDVFETEGEFVEQGLQRRRFGLGFAIQDIDHLVEMDDLALFHRVAHFHTNSELATQCLPRIGIRNAVHFAFEVSNKDGRCRGIGGCQLAMHGDDIAQSQGFCIFGALSTDDPDGGLLALIFCSAALQKLLGLPRARVPRVWSSGREMLRQESPTTNAPLRVERTERGHHHGRKVLRDDMHEFADKMPKRFFQCGGGGVIHPFVFQNLSIHLLDLV